MFIPRDLSVEASTIDQHYDISKQKAKFNHSKLLTWYNWGSPSDTPVLMIQPLFYVKQRDKWCDIEIHAKLFFLVCRTLFHICCSILNTLAINRIHPFLNWYFDNIEAQLVQIVKESQKIGSKYWFFQFFFANTLGVPGKGL